MKLVSQTEFLSVIAVGETVSMGELARRLGLVGVLGQVNLSRTALRLRKWGHIEPVLLGETDRGGRIWGYKRLW